MVSFNNDFEIQCEGSQNKHLSRNILIKIIRKNFTFKFNFREGDGFHSIICESNT